MKGMLQLLKETFEKDVFNELQNIAKNQVPETWFFYTTKLIERFVFKEYNKKNSVREGVKRNHESKQKLKIYKGLSCYRFFKRKPSLFCDQYFIGIDCDGT